MSWNHNWSSYLTTGVTARWQRDEYQNFDRTDDTRSLGLRVGYRFRPWLSAGRRVHPHEPRFQPQQRPQNKNSYLLRRRRHRAFERRTIHLLRAGGSPPVSDMRKIARGFALILPGVFFSRAFCAAAVRPRALLPQLSRRVT